MPTNRYHVLAVILVVLFAGCSGMAGLGGPSVSNAEATVVDGQPAVTFDYDIDDYAIAMLEDPDGNVVSETRIEPAHNSSAIAMGETKRGEYQLLIRQGDETVVSESLEFDGPNVQISSVEDNWSGNSLESVTVIVENTGDLPARLQDGSFEVDGSEIEGAFYQPVEAGETETLVVESSFGGPTFEEAGQVDGAVTIRTTDGMLSQDFSTILEPASLSMESVEPEWSGNALELVTVEVVNEGDVPTSANITVEHQGEDVASTRNRPIDPDEQREFEATPSFSSFEVESGGEASFDVYVNSPANRVEGEFTQDIQGAEVSLQSVDSTWEHGQLTEVLFTADNAGDVSADYDATLEVNGETIEEGEVTVPADGASGETFAVDSIYSSFGYVAASGGEYDVTLTIHTEDGPISATETSEFDGVDSTLSEIDATFYDTFDTSGSELSRVSLSVRNEGDISLRYDSIEIEIDGVSRTYSPYATQEVEPGASTTEYVTISNNIAVDEGSHDLTIRLVLNGDTIASETTTVSTD